MAVGATAIIVLFGTMQALGCGESLLRSGFGLNIPGGKVERAANIVIYTPSDKGVFFDDAKVATRLSKLGHNVTVVHDGIAPTGTEPVAFDIVLARVVDFDSVREVMGGRVANAVFVPVRDGFMATGDKESVSSNAPLRQLLAVLKQALQTQQPVQA